MEENKKDLVVLSEYLLYRIADAGLLNKLTGVAPSHKRMDKKVYYFERSEDIEKIIEDYRAERHAEKKNDASKLYLSGETINAIVSAVVERLKSGGENDAQSNEVSPAAD